jgi:hypothetical protein
LELRVHCVNHPVLFLHTSPCVFPSQKVGVATTIAPFCGRPLSFMLPRAQVWMFMRGRSATA